MENRQIVFTEKNKAELLSVPTSEVGEGQALVKTLYTAISAGTEYANITGDPNTSIYSEKADVTFPRTSGYCGVGIVERIGENVKSVKVGDAVAMSWCNHKKYNTLHESLLTSFDGIEPIEVALTHIATFPMLALRRIKVQVGEPCMVVGLGILGLLAVELCRAAGAYPVIAVDLEKERRDIALRLGADYALNSSEPDFKDRIMALTCGKGVPAVIEVTGVGAALKAALSVTAEFGRLAQLGCTREPVDGLDFYRLVHGKGVSVIGAHTNARPGSESNSEAWTTADDRKAIINLTKGGRINQRALIGEIHSPENAPEVYSRLVNDYKHFPIGVLFDWTKI